MNDTLIYCMFKECVNKHTKKLTNGGVDFMERLTHKQQETLIRIFNKLGWFPKDRLIQNMTYREYQYWLRVYYEQKVS